MWPKAIHFSTAILVVWSIANTAKTRQRDHQPPNSNRSGSFPSPLGRGQGEGFVFPTIQAPIPLIRPSGVLRTRGLFGPSQPPATGRRDPSPKRRRISSFVVGDDGGSEQLPFVQFFPGSSMVEHSTVLNNAAPLGNRRVKNQVNSGKPSS